MNSSVANESAAAHHIRCETPKPRMAKVELSPLTLREKREEYGRILRRASELAGMNRDQTAAFAVEWHNSDRLTIAYLDQHEFLPAAFRIATGVIVPAGGYDYASTSVSYALGQQRMVSGTLSGSRGSFYGGTRTTGGYSGRVGISPRLIVEPGVTLNRISLPFGRFSANILSTRVVLTPTPRMQAASLIQYNPTAHTLTASARLRWEYTPGSEFFVVFTDGRNTAPVEGTPGLVNRSVAVKLTRLLRF